MAEWHLGDGTKVTGVKHVDGDFEYAVKRKYVV